MAEEPENLVLLQLQGIRREMTALLERQLRDRELISKVYNELLAFRSEAREEIRGLKSDLVLLETKCRTGITRCCRYSGGSTRSAPPPNSLARAAHHGAMFCADEIP